LKAWKFVRVDADPHFATLIPEIAFGEQKGLSISQTDAFEGTFCREIKKLSRCDRAF
jgi:hypothetical protein